MKNKVFLLIGIPLLLGSALILLFGESWQLPFGSGSPYLFFTAALGWLFLCHALAGLYTKRLAKTHPETVRRVAIEQADERNIAIANKAKAKAYDRMLYIFSALVILLAVMGVGVAAVLLMVAAYLVVVGSNIYYLNRYQKEE